MIEVKGRLEGSHQMTAFWYQSGMMIMQSTLQNMVPTRSPLNTSDTVSKCTLWLLTVIFKKYEGALCIVICAYNVENYTWCKPSLLETCNGKYYKEDIKEGIKTGNGMVCNGQCQAFSLFEHL